MGKISNVVSAEKLRCFGAGTFLAVFHQCDTIRTAIVVVVGLQFFDVAGHRYLQMWLLLFVVCVAYRKWSVW